MVNLVFEVLDIFEDVVGVVNVKIKEIGLVIVLVVFVVFNVLVVISKMFDLDFIVEGFNSDVIELSNDEVVVICVVGYELQCIQVLDEVRI